METLPVILQAKILSHLIPFYSFTSSELFPYSDSFKMLLLEEYGSVLNLVRAFRSYGFLFFESDWVQNMISHQQIQYHRSLLLSKNYQDSLYLARRNPHNTCYFLHYADPIIPPPEIATMHSLTTLIIRFCRPLFFSDHLGQLKYLSRLYLDNDHLTTLPSFIRSLSHLEYLIIHDNAISEIPSWIGELTSLHTLDLSDNQITTLPSSIGHLTMLVNFEIYRNRLIALPETIYKMVSLQYLQISKNQLGSIPESMGYLENLKFLNLAGNPLTEIPGILFSLPHLQSITIPRHRIQFWIYRFRYGNCRF